MLHALPLAFNFIYLFIWLYRAACGILVPQPGIEPTPPEVEARSPNHWTTREVSPLYLLNPAGQVVCAQRVWLGKQVNAGWSS